MRTNDSLRQGFTDRILKVFLDDYQRSRFVARNGRYKTDENGPPLGRFCAHKQGVQMFIGRKKFFQSILQ